VTAASHELPVSRDELRDVERENLVERAEPVPDESILKGRDDLPDKHIAPDDHRVVRKIHKQIADRVRSQGIQNANRTPWIVILIVRSSGRASR